ncbi:hypothetical protein RI129_004264 [Pyrocoelia pectoralis]|uniref:Cytochrome P450 n=1 Tax=Pyrocoelia pectoralis TaxID=417401 RepID=A0AAN7ZGN6_9COLE
MLQVLHCLLLILLFQLCIWFYIYYTKPFDYWKVRKVPFVQPKFPFGSLTDVFITKAHPGKFIGNICNKTKERYFGFYAFNRPYLVVNDPEFIKTILIKDFKYFSNRYFICDDTIDYTNSTGLFAIKNPKWRSLRTKMNPAFSLSKLNLMVPLIKAVNVNLNLFIIKHIEKSVEVKEMCAKYTTDVIASCFFGLSVNSFEIESQFRIAGRRLLSRSFWRSLSVLSYYYAPKLVETFRFRFLESSAVAFLGEVFRNTIEGRRSSKIRRNDFIDILIKLRDEAPQDGDFNFDDSSLVAQAVTFFSSGFESSASTIAFTLHELAVHADIQARLRREVEEVIQEHGGLVYHAINDMSYLHMVISESLRKYPTTSFIHRECVKNYVVPETGLLIEKGTPIVISQYGLHYNNANFPNPEKFDPERFNTTNIHQIKSCTYLPFSDGPRNCIGQMFGLLMVKMGIIEIIRNFEVTTNEMTKEPVILEPFPIIQAKYGLNLTFLSTKAST